MTSTLDRILKREWVSDISDERSAGNSIIIGLTAQWDFDNDPGCGTQGFDTWADAEKGTRRDCIGNDIQNGTSVQLMTECYTVQAITDPGSSLDGKRTTTSSDSSKRGNPRATH